MQLSPEEYAEYTDAIETERMIFKTLLEKYELDKVELDQLVSAVNASGAALAVEMYIERFLDGGHVAMAFQKNDNNLTFGKLLYCKFQKCEVE